MYESINLEKCAVWEACRKSISASHQTWGRRGDVPWRQSQTTHPSATPSHESPSACAGRCTGTVKSRHGKRESSTDGYCHM